VEILVATPSISCKILTVLTALSAEGCGRTLMPRAERRVRRDLERAGDARAGVPFIGHA
jgi:hypothetical protein